MKRKALGRLNNKKKRLGTVILKRGLKASQSQPSRKPEVSKHLAHDLPN